MWEVELTFAALLCAWVIYELYGRTALEWMATYAMWIRIAGGAAVLAFLYWQARAAPEAFQDTLTLAKDMLTHQGPSGTHGDATSGTTKEKRNVTGLTKKRVAASQEWRCGACKELLDETYEVDHKVALFNGGTNDPANLVALCPHCHRKKTVDERLA
jgi:HNH endonuclease